MRIREFPKTRSLYMAERSMMPVVCRTRKLDAVDFKAI
jgi:hypothetical protein